MEWLVHRCSLNSFQNLWTYMGRGPRRCPGYNLCRECRRCSTSCNMARGRGVRSTLALLPLWRCLQVLCVSVCVCVCECVCVYHTSDNFSFFFLLLGPPTQVPLTQPSRRQESTRTLKRGPVVGRSTRKKADVSTKHRYVRMFIRMYVCIYIHTYVQNGEEQEKRPMFPPLRKPELSRVMRRGRLTDSQKFLI